MDSGLWPPVEYNSGNTMSVFLSILAAAVTLLLGWRLYRRRQYQQLFGHIPGPAGVPLLQNALQLDFPKLPWILTQWGKVYGPVYKVGLMGTYMVIIDGYDAIHECLVTRGKSTATRINSFGVKHVFGENGLFRSQPDEEWKTLRKVFHQYMKQFDVGMHVLEDASMKQCNEMLNIFHSLATENRELDPWETVRNTSLKTILLILCGESIPEESQLFSDIKQYETLFWKVIAGNTFDAVLLDAFPCLVHTPLPTSKMLSRASQLQNNIALELKCLAMSRDPEQTLMGCMYQYATPGNAGKRVHLHEGHVTIVTVGTIAAGFGSSSVSFYFLLNLLAHHQAVQERIAEEVSKIGLRPEEHVSLKCRESLPFTRATLLEQQRYQSVGAVLARATACTTSIFGATIPENTVLMVNGWGMHHDKEFWGDPERFRPERFLDASGNLVPADHPRRRHLMPFSAGIRGCPGEQFAMSRLFLWLSNTCMRFRIMPGTDNSPGLVSQEALVHDFLMYPPKFKISFEKRTFDL